MNAPRIGEVWYRRENPEEAVTISDVWENARGEMVRGQSVTGRAFSYPLAEWLAKMARTPSEAAFPMTRLGDIMPPAVAELERHEQLQAAELAPKVPEDF